MQLFSWLVAFLKREAGLALLCEVMVLSVEFTQLINPFSDRISVSGVLM